MPVTIIVGGQFGSEGKGKVAHYFAQNQNAEIAVRVGGPNSGHTVINERGDRIVLKQLPTASINRNIKCVIAAGSYINPEILLKEIEMVELDEENLIIDPQAMVISEKEIENEKNGLLRDSIGSTTSGTGEAVIQRIRRNKETLLAKDTIELQPYVKPTIDYMRNALSERKRILIEGTQGFGLSLLHSRFYPYATSRDTTAASFLSEAGLSPLDVDDIILVIRAFPIRVGGNSGPLPNEIDWDSITTNSGSKKPILEHTSVTHKIRRVAHFDPEIVIEAIKVNWPTKIVLNHVDYFDIECQMINSLTEKARFMVSEIEKALEHKIDYLGFGPDSLVKNNQKVNERELSYD